MAHKNALEIWKFTLAPGNDIRRIEMPTGARVLSVGQQDDEIKLWALVRPSAPREHRYFLVLETGRPFMDAGDLRFVGTVLTKLGGYVTHVFEVTPQAQEAGV